MTTTQRYKLGLAAIIGVLSVFALTGWGFAWSMATSLDETQAELKEQKQIVKKKQSALAQAQSETQKAKDQAQKERAKKKEWQTLSIELVEFISVMDQVINGKASLQKLNRAVQDVKEQVNRMEKKGMGSKKLQKRLNVQSI